MFIGEHQHNLDSKGRIIVPVKFREELGDKMIVSRGLDGCLTIYTLEKWREVVEELNKLPTTKSESRMYKRIVLSKAELCELDTQGRIRIPSFLCEEAHLAKECVVVGVGEYVEIWDKTIRDRYYDAASERFEEIAETLTEFFR